MTDAELDALETRLEILENLPDPSNRGEAKKRTAAIDELIADIHVQLRALISRLNRVVN